MEQLRSRVRGGATLAERLLLAVGQRAEPLLKALGNLASLDFIRNAEPLELARLVLAHLGPATLVMLRDVLEAEGLKPPGRWNTAQARAFVASLGFPEEFALAAEARREPEELVSGPIPLPPLHDFQQEVLDNVKDLLAPGSGRRRAVISLPTGAGKTRVTVEAAVQFVLRPNGSRRRVLWIAQTDELCEQAVQAFRQVWINLGAQDTNLRVVRLWGGNPDPTSGDPNQPVVVVATIQTLTNRLWAAKLTSLEKPGLVVLDECHHAIAPSYTKVLRWFHADSPKPDEAEEQEPPILGLSATPFRTTEEESRLLARRFDHRLFPSDQKGLHERLLARGILARVTTEPLESGFAPPEDLLETLFLLSEKGEGVEFERQLEMLNELLARDQDRNNMLIERIKMAEETSVLFFANSVLHAEEISARLNLAGIPSAPISAETPMTARRYFLDQFKQGELRVLCNYTLLSTGFDAPKTEMIVIARQVFSPVRYMQMVGRGLRGPKNGGMESCRIVTVLDNLGQFQDRHPYHYCQKYFGNTENNVARSIANPR
ncbi:MAG: DEAD/DEAH box helicase [Thermoanaerobaculum sp.]|nr:DEAD/DEAH box helicase [Thermoanaerobaculum sp.]